MKPSRRPAIKETEAQVAWVEQIAVTRRPDEQLELEVYESVCREACRWLSAQQATSERFTLRCTDVMYKL